ncbi:MAG: Lar family restriction alleviation protein [Faecalibacterium sp.]|nr:Lar family restriction alleviation protein [Ruminococcus sp.]MCM1392088.1 Lar family restriction alleviation protein [Ruminococcus sp.]MCM1485785.1 Lar family restriction alleviation protein [Faecalibacterium sp.]
MNGKLKPCPFCGSENVQLYYQYHVGYYVECNNCYGKMHWFSSDGKEAINVWNTFEGRQKGTWEICSDGYYPYCSNCGEEPYRENNKNLPNFCPNCGADMRKENSNA